MPFSSKRGAHSETPIFSLPIDDKYVIDIMYLDHGVIRTRDGSRRMTYKIINNRLSLEYPDTLPKSIVKIIVKDLKLEGITA
ncbi:hypothetical protein D3C74_411690 [compost metagenome]